MRILIYFNETSLYNSQELNTFSFVIIYFLNQEIPVTLIV